MRIGNAPVSWGVFEVASWSANPPYSRVMDEIAASGYEGTELGPWGYYPTDPSLLKTEIDARGLSLASAFVPLDLTDPRNHDAAERQAMEVANLLQTMGTRELILADPQRSDRTLCAGRAGPADEMAPAAWQATIDELNRIGRRLADRGMTAVFHHHVATYIETGPEIDRLLEQTDPRYVGLCLDTGHAVYGGADPVDLVRRWSDRVRYVHLKDVDPRALERARSQQLDFEAGIRLGVFCPLGQGTVDFSGVFGELRRIGYDGWLIVEQDVIVDGTGASTVAPLEAARQSRAFLDRFMR